MPKLYVRDGVAGKERLLIDPTAQSSQGGHAEIGWFEPSKDARYLAYGMAVGGAEWGELRVVAVETGKPLAEKIDRVWAGGDGSTASWLPDNRTLAYLRFPKLAPGQPPQEKQLRSRVYVHTIGRNVSGDGDTAVFGFGVNPGIEIPPEAFCFVTSLPGAPSYVVASLQTAGVDYGGIYIAPLATLAGGSPAWKKVAGPEDQVSTTGRLLAHGDHFYFLSHKNAPRYQVARVDMSTATGVAQASVVVPESKVVIEDIAAAQDGLYIQDLDGGVSRLRRLPWSDGAAASVIALPFAGSIQHVSTSPSLTGALLRFRAWNHPNEILQVDPQKQASTNTGWQEAPAVDFSDIDALEVNAVSYDGTLVPLSILIRKDAKRDGSHAALLDS